MHKINHYFMQKAIIVDENVFGSSKWALCVNLSTISNLHLFFPIASQIFSDTVKGITSSYFPWKIKTGQEIF